MKTEEYLKFHETLCVLAQQITRAEIHDFATPKSTPNDKFAIFKNFLLVEKLGICSISVGFLVLICDKIQRLHYMVGPSTIKVKETAIRDLVIDLINYLILLVGYVYTKQEGIENQEER